MIASALCKSAPAQDLAGAHQEHPEQLLRPVSAQSPPFPLTALPEVSDSGKEVTELPTEDSSLTDT